MSGSLMIAVNAGCVPRFHETIMRGVVSTPSMRWPKLAADGNSVNMLTSQRLTDKGGGPTFYSCLVEVEGVD